jgi:hypothetical protein
LASFIARSKWHIRKFINSLFLLIYRNENMPNIPPIIPKAAQEIMMIEKNVDWIIISQSPFLY